MLKKGSLVQAKLIEALAKNQWIVSFNGQLIQVRNTTSIDFKEGLHLQLEVTQENPVTFKVLESKRNGLKLSIRA